MPDDTSELLQGTLDLLILKALVHGAMHGWGVSQRIQRMSRDVLRDAMLPVLAGLLAAVGGAAMLTRLARALLHGVSPMDAPTISAAALLLAAVAAIAAFIPARRAAQVDPMIALREG